MMPQAHAGAASGTGRARMLVRFGDARALVAHARPRASAAASAFDSELDPPAARVAERVARDLRDRGGDAASAPGRSKPSSSATSRARWRAVTTSLLVVTHGRRSRSRSSSRPSAGHDHRDVVAAAREVAIQHAGDQAGIALAGARDRRRGPSRVRQPVGVHARAAALGRSGYANSSDPPRARGRAMPGIETPACAYRLVGRRSSPRCCRSRRSEPARRCGSRCARPRRPRRASRAAPHCSASTRATGRAPGDSAEARAPRSRAATRRVGAVAEAVGDAAPWHAGAAAHSLQASPHAVSPGIGTDDARRSASRRRPAPRYAGRSRSAPPRRPGPRLHVERRRQPLRPRRARCPGCRRSSSRPRRQRGDVRRCPGRGRARSRPPRRPAPPR